MVLDSWKREKPALLGGVLAGAGVSLAGNMHYVVIGKLLPWIREIFHLPKGDYTYWFPNSTRYIGYSGFRDRGYLVAKIFGIAGAGFLMWLGASTGIVPFTHVSCLVSTGVLAAVCWGEIGRAHV